MQQKQGLIAILDALGAANYSSQQIEQFLKSRQVVLDLLATNAEIKAFRGRIQPGQVTTFTFNDTVLIVYGTDASPTFDDVRHFCILLRRFQIDSLIHGILFRGSLSVGTFHVDDDTNTVMGEAVTDAAAWYDSADWVGINATPYASLFVQSLLDQTGDDLGHVLIDWDVPLKDNKGSRRLKALNWPKVFVVPNMTPCVQGEHPRAKCATLLSVNGVPKGTELKFTNTMKFYDECVRLREEAVARQAQTRTAQLIGRSQRRLLESGRQPPTPIRTRCTNPIWRRPGRPPSLTREPYLSC